jgi:hypothetical protein
MKPAHALLLTAVVSLAPLAAQAVPACSFSNLSGVTVTDCAGFYEGNLISGNADTQAEVAGILSSQFGASSTGAWIEKIDNLSGSTIDFSTPLSGDVIVGMHFGNGAFPADDRGQGGGTAFYMFSAGTTLDSFATTLQGLSNAALYAVSSTAPIAEPNTYALMIAGLLAMAAVARKRTAAQRR